MGLCPRGDATFFFRSNRSRTLCIRWNVRGSVRTPPPTVPMQRNSRGYGAGAAGTPSDDEPGGADVSSPQSGVIFPERAPVTAQTVSPQGRAVPATAGSSPATCLVVARL